MYIPGVKLEAGDRILVIKADGTWVELPVLLCKSQGLPLKDQSYIETINKSDLIQSLEEYEKGLLPGSVKIHRYTIGVDWSDAKGEQKKVIEKVEKLTLDKETDLVSTVSGPSRNPCGFCKGTGLVYLDQVPSVREKKNECPICGGKGVR